MLLSKLLENVDVIEKLNYKDCNITSITDKSDDACESMVFCCVVGEKKDAHSFIKKSIEKGCRIFLVERLIMGLSNDIVQIRTSNVRQQMCIMLSNLYGNCHKKMDLIGVTGTNGKTSITFMLKYIFEKFKVKVGIIGTTGYYICNNRYETKLTTPDSVDLHRILYHMYSEGVEVVVMEVSAHSIYFDKIYGLRFKYGIFTNLTQDHLDFFLNMENYANAKYKFLKEYCDKIIINIDDNYGKKFKNLKNVKTYSINNNADICAINIRQELNMVKFDIIFEKECKGFKYYSCGVFNIYNLLPCIMILNLYGYSITKIRSAIKGIKEIKGRLDIKKNAEYVVCIDYAHTPDALQNVLKTLKRFTKDLIVVFGSSGNRDSLKRKDMGIIVSKYADYIILTADNSRYENDSDIFFDLSICIDKPFIIEKNRAYAIKYAFSIATKNSIIAILGKGVENYQDIKAIKVKYSDYVEIEKYIK